MKLAAALRDRRLFFFWRRSAHRPACTCANCQFGYQSNS